MLTSIDVKFFKFKFLIWKEVQILKRFKLNIKEIKIRMVFDVNKLIDSSYVWSQQAF